MTNTIPNVPRELLERILGCIDAMGWDRLEADIRAILSAPSPAGVDGWDVAGDILEKLSAAQAIIDGLRGEVYDEEKERALFEVSLDPAVYPSASVFGADSLDPGQYCDPNLERRWRGWLACAKSRALSAVCAAAPNIATTSEHSGS